MKKFIKKLLSACMFVTALQFPMQLHCWHDQSQHTNNTNATLQHTVYLGKEHTAEQSLSKINSGINYHHSHVIPDFESHSMSATSCGLRQLYDHLNNKVSPLFFALAKSQLTIAIPGYIGPQGLRELFLNVSGFTGCDQQEIVRINNILESYFTRIEAVLFDKHGVFKEFKNITFDDRVVLAHVCVDFLKEFYSTIAKSTFAELSCYHPAYTQVYNQNKNSSWENDGWFSLFDGKDVYSKQDRIDDLYQGSINGNLGRVHKALDNKDFAQALQLGTERVAITTSRWFRDPVTKQRSVFDVYPHLHQLTVREYEVKQRAAQEQQIIQQKKYIAQVKYLEPEYMRCVDQPIWENSYDTIDQRLEIIMSDCNSGSNALIQELMHSPVAEVCLAINTAELTADQKGIMLKGGPLQHLFLDETCTALDCAVELYDTNEFRLVGETLIDFSNAAIVSNKQGDLIRTSRILDACWMIIDCTKTLSVPLIEGVIDSVKNNVHMISHPIETAENIALSIAACGYHIGKATYAIAECEAIVDLYETHPELADKMMQKYLERPSSFADIYEYFTTISKEDILRTSARCGTDILLGKGLFKFLSYVGAKNIPLLTSYMRKGSSAVAGEVAVTAEGVPIRCRSQIAEFAYDTQKAGGATAATEIVSAEIVATETAIVLSPRAIKALKAFKVSEYDATIGDLSKLEKAVELFKHTPGAMENDGPLLKALECGVKTATPGNLNTARGAMYELEKAIELHEKGEKITNLGKKWKGREFDIITDHLWVECKNIDWATRVGQSEGKLKADLCGLRHIAIEEGKLFEFHSKQCIPAEWKKWLSEKSIKYVEDKKV